MNYYTNSYLETIEFGKKVGKLLKENDVILLAGDLGAGKTTFTKGIGISLGIKRTINSPTFTIVKEYNGDKKLFHLDLYRLEGMGQDFYLEEYFNSGAVVVCEWPLNIEEILPHEYLMINIYYEGETKRRFELIAKGKRYEELKGEILC